MIYELLSGLVWSGAGLLFGYMYCCVLRRFWNGQGGLL